MEVGRFVRRNFPLSEVCARVMQFGGIICSLNLDWTITVLLIAKIDLRGAKYIISKAINIIK